MDSTQIKKAQVFSLTEFIKNNPRSSFGRTIIERATGSITIFSLDSGQSLAEKTLPFDTFIQVIDGIAEVRIDDQLTTVSDGEGIIVPAHSRNSFKANIPFAMLTTIIKSGYEEVIT